MFERGKLILVPFPFTDLTAQKIRPALIISSNQPKNKDIIVIFISSRSTFKKEKYSYLIEKTDKEFKQTGLKADSVIRCDKIATLDKKIVLGEIGELSARHFNNIDKLLKGALEL